MVNIPENEYGCLKKKGEHYTNKLNGINIRLWNVYDVETVNLRSHVICDFIEKALNNKVINIISNGREERQFLHANDCSRIMHYIFENYEKFVNKDYIDVSNFKWISIKNVAEIIQSIIKCDITFGDKKDYYIKNEPDKFILDYIKPEISLKDGIQDMINKIKEKNSKKK